MAIPIYRSGGSVGGYREFPSYLEDINFYSYTLNARHVDILSNRTGSCPIQRPKVLQLSGLSPYLRRDFRATLYLKPISSSSQVTVMSERRQDNRKNVEPYLHSGPTPRTYAHTLDRIWIIFSVGIWYYKSKNKRRVLTDARCYKQK